MRRAGCLLRRPARAILLTLSTWLAGSIPAFSADTTTHARFVEPTNRYGHAVLGDDVEYGALEVTVENSAPSGLPDAVVKRSVITIRLPQDRVFEDLEPRLVDVDQDGTAEVVVVETQAQTGAQLAVYNARGRKIAATPHIGTPNRWLAPIGATDLDGDGFVELAYIDRPHLAKTLRIWRYRNRKLEPVAEKPGLTNHQIGWDHIPGGIRDCGHGPEIIVASADWLRMTSARLVDGQIETQDLGPLQAATDLNHALTCP